jgi:hypothetical protein
MNLGIRIVEKKFVVYDIDTNRNQSPKYQDEVHALRYIKLITRFKQDWRLLKVHRDYKAGDVIPESPKENPYIKISTLEDMITMPVEEKKIENIIEEPVVPRVIKRRQRRPNKKGGK